MGAMNTYQIRIGTEQATPVFMEMRRPRFTRREYKMVLDELSMWAGYSIDFKHLKADVFCNGQEVFQIQCETAMTGPTIESIISMNGEPVRHMTLAA